MTIIFEPLIRSDQELTDVTRALRMLARDEVSLAEHCSSADNRLKYEKSAARLLLLITNLNSRYDAARGQS